MWSIAAVSKSIYCQFPAWGLTCGIDFICYIRVLVPNGTSSSLTHARGGDVASFVGNPIKGAVCCFEDLGGLCFYGWHYALFVYIDDYEGY